LLTSKSEDVLLLLLLLDEPASVFGLSGEADEGWVGGGELEGC